jgi:hypothetical protein
MPTSILIYTSLSRPDIELFLLLVAYLLKTIHHPRQLAQLEHIFTTTTYFVSSPPASSQLSGLSVLYHHIIIHSCFKLTQDMTIYLKSCSCSDNIYMCARCHSGQPYSAVRTASALLFSQSLAPMALCCWLRTRRPSRPLLSA